MTTNLKRFFSFMLSVIMVLAALPGGALAANANDNELKTYNSDPRAYIMVKSTDNNGQPLAGTQFLIRNEQGLTLETLTTGNNGMASTAKQYPVGTYEVQLLFATDGYVPNDTMKKVEIGYNNSPIVPFTSGKMSSIVVYSYDSTNNPIVGAKYTIVDAVSGAEIEQVTTGETGIAVSKELTPGVYLIRELWIPDKYVMGTPYDQPLIVSADKATPARFPHTIKGTIQILTVDNTTNVLLPGAEYIVEDHTGNLVNRYSVTDAKVGIVTESLPNGEYTIKQVTPPDGGYSLRQTSQRVFVTGDQTSSITFRNEKLSGLVIESVVQGTHDRLSDTIFEVYDPHQKQIFCGPADSNGLITLPNIPAGVYLVKHIASPDGYSVQEDIRKVTITVNDLTTAVFESIPLTNLTVTLRDKDTKELLPGSKFRVQQIGGQFVAEAVTDENGSFTVEHMPAGMYIVSQIAPPENYQLMPDYQFAKVEIGSNTHIQFTNAHYSGLTIQAIKLGTGAGLPGAVFQVLEENGKLVGEYISDFSGNCYVGQLEPGVYLIKEISSPEHYTIMTPDQKITITNGLNTTATFKHQATSALTVQALDISTRAFLSGAVFNLTTTDGTFIEQITTGSDGRATVQHLEPGYYTLTCIKVPYGCINDVNPQTIKVENDSNKLVEVFLNSTSDLKVTVLCEQTGKPVDNVTLKLTTLDGDMVGTYTTNEFGTVSLVVNPGDYILYPTYVPDGYVLDSTPVNIKITENMSKKIELKISKMSTLSVKMVDAKTHDGIYRVRVEVKDWRNNHAGIFTSDNKGYFHFTDVLPDGRYILTLVDCPSNYIPDEVPKTVELSIKEDTHVVWELEPVRGQVIITTKAATANAQQNIPVGAVLPGAIYNILDESNNVVNVIYGDDYGEAFSGALPIGNYTIRQIQAPYGYVVNDTRIPFRVTDTNKKINITVLNKCANLSSTVDVGGPKVAYSGSQIKYYFTDIRNTSGATVEQFLFHIKLPTDAIRAGTLYTGTWTGTGNEYRIDYQTNYNDYRVLASGLNPQSQYDFDLSSDALRLMDGEFVTNIRFVFANAVAGFHSELAPTMYAYILPTIPNGYQIINRVEAAMCLNSQWAKSVNTWTTTAILLNSVPNNLNVVTPGPDGSMIGTNTVVFPSKLPKTGN